MPITLHDFPLGRLVEFDQISQVGKTKQAKIKSHLVGGSIKRI